MSSGVASRILAFDLLDEVNRNGAYANLALPKILAGSKLGQQDRAFVTELSYGTIRMQGKYDFYISNFSDRPIDEIDPKLLDVLRLGAHQLFGMRVPTHAAINETIEVAKRVVGKSRASFANAMLRKLSTIEDEELFINSRIESPTKRLSIRHSHPEWILLAFYDRLRDWLEVEKLLIANNTAAKPNLIAWPNLSTVEELVAQGGVRIDFTEYGVIAQMPPDNYKSVNERRAGVQDAGSQYLTEIFHATKTNENEKWLDLCSAPGGKAKLLYELLGHKNFIANEVNPARLRLLQGILPPAVLTNIDGRKSEDFDQKFDRILIDAPCTGLGALRRRPEARWRKSLSDLKELIELQKRLIDSAVSLLNPGGVIGYATC